MTREPQLYEGQQSGVQPIHWSVGQIAAPVETLRPNTRCADVYNKLIAHPDIQAAAIVNGASKICGLVNRHRFLERYSQRYIPEIYGARPIETMANLTPLIVDESLAVAELGAALAETPDAIMNGFVITRQGRYLGICTGDALVRAKVKLLLRQEKVLRAAVDEAKEANKTKSNFLALMSHELRTPLNAIIGFSEVLQSELFGPMGSDRYLEYAKHVHDAGHHLLQLINDILDLSKAEAGKMEFNWEHVAIADVISECCELLDHRANEKRLRLAREIAGGLPLLYADRLRVKQILLNLLSNAIKFTPIGGSVTVFADCDIDGGIVMKVTDTGIGIAPEMIPLVLEPFRQVSSPMAREVEGTGLGLSLVTSLAEQHGGIFTLESEEGVGTSAIVRFPNSFLSEGVEDGKKKVSADIRHLPVVNTGQPLTRTRSKRAS